jgi:hypothetical protein
MSCRRSYAFRHTRVISPSHWPLPKQHATLTTDTSLSPGGIGTRNPQQGSGTQTYAFDRADTGSGVLDGVMRLIISSVWWGGKYGNASACTLLDSSRSVPPCYTDFCVLYLFSGIVQSVYRLDRGSSPGGDIPRLSRRTLGPIQRIVEPMACLCGG